MRNAKNKSRFSSFCIRFAGLIALAFLVAPLIAFAQDAPTRYDDASTAKQASTTKLDFVPNVPIPGVSFASQAEVKSGYVYIPLLAQYISGVYRYLVGASVAIAAVMIVYGGFRYVAGSSIDSIQKGKSIISNAVIGLILLLGTYSILWTINPNLLSLQPLKLLDIEKLRQKIVRDLRVEGTGDDRPLSEILTSMKENTDAWEAATVSDRVVIVDIEGNIKPKDPACEKPNSGQCLMTAFCNPSRPTGGSDGKFPRSAKATSEEGKAAKTYEEKIQILEKVVMGFYEVCVKRGKCSYVQGGSAGGGKVSGGGLPNFIMREASNNGCTDCAEPAGLYKKAAELAPEFSPIVDQCTATGEASLNIVIKGKPLKGNACYSAANVVYRKLVLDKIQDAGNWAGDCGMFDISVYMCTGTDFDLPPEGKTGSFYYTSWPGSETRKLPKAFIDALAQINKADSDELRAIWQKGYDRQYEEYQRIYKKNSAKYDDVVALKDNPQMILSARMIDYINDPSMLEKKGGIKFGDMVFTCCEFQEKSSNHWLMYTGGRGLPFGFIDMGSGAGGVPGAPALGGVGVYPKDMTLFQYLHKRLTNNGGLVADPRLGGIWVWRPFTDAAEPVPASPP